MRYTIVYPWILPSDRTPGLEEDASPKPKAREEGEDKSEVYPIIVESFIVVD